LRNNGVGKRSLIGTLYKLEASINDGCNSFVVPEVRNEIKKTLMFPKRRQCFGIKDWDILERRGFKICTLKVWLKEFLIAP
jgi:hypothetical protein